LIAVRFPKFGDGRGYSIARLLRERYGYRGELRAVGDVLRDQLLFMKRSGFDSFSLREDQDPDEAPLRVRRALRAVSGLQHAAAAALPAAPARGTRRMSGKVYLVGAGPARQIC
jgi:uncharacterized protein (DUF934 family)